jgi:hypothetical protein
VGLLILTLTSIISGGHRKSEVFPCSNGLDDNPLNSYLHCIAVRIGCASHRHAPSGDSNYVESELVRSIKPIFGCSYIDCSTDACHRSIVLMAVCEKLLSVGDGDDKQTTLNFVHDYLESRLVLLKDLKVSRQLLLSNSLHINLNQYSSNQKGVIRS